MQPYVAVAFVFRISVSHRLLEVDGDGDGLEVIWLHLFNETIGFSWLWESNDVSES